MSNLKYTRYGGVVTERSKRTPEEWGAGLHDVLVNGEAVSEVRLHPAVLAIIHRDKIDLYLNCSATEPRWEAWSERCPGGSFGGDPNAVALECAAKVLASRLQELMGERADMREELERLRKERR